MMAELLWFKSGRRLGTKSVITPIHSPQPGGPWNTISKPWDPTLCFSFVCVCVCVLTIITLISHTYWSPGIPEQLSWVVLVGGVSQ